MSDEEHDKPTPRPGSAGNGRRKFCKVCIGGMTVVSMGTVAFPVFSFMGQPMRFGANKPLEIPLAKLKPGQAEYVQFQGQQVVVLVTEGGPRVFSASCPHLGCNVVWEASKGVFHCPCHGAVFDASGQVVSGPVSAPLNEIEFEIEGDKIVVG
jgi:Rieske Fe-S protein